VKPPGSCKIVDCYLPAIRRTLRLCGGHGYEHDLERVAKSNANRDLRNEKIRLRKEDALDVAAELQLEFVGAEVLVKERSKHYKKFKKDAGDVPFDIYLEQLLEIAPEARELHAVKRLHDGYRPTTIVRKVASPRRAVMQRRQEAPRQEAVAFPPKPIERGEDRSRQGPPLPAPTGMYNYPPQDTPLREQQVIAKPEPQHESSSGSELRMLGRGLDGLGFFDEPDDMDVDQEYEGDQEDDDEVTMQYR
jgi:hypothetical protein